MRSRRLTVCLSLVSFLFASSMVWGAPKTIEFESKHCYAGDLTTIKFSKQHWAFSYQLTGTNMSTKSDGTQGIFSTHCVGAGIFEGEVFTIDARCEYVDNDGDKYYGKAHRVGPKGEWTFVEGTGKFEGITGSGTYTPAAKFPTIVPGKFQGCLNTTGHYTLP